MANTGKTSAPSVDGSEPSLSPSHTSLALEAHFDEKTLQTVSVAHVWLTQPFGSTKEKSPPSCKCLRDLTLYNSGDRTRTCDPLVNSQLLYQLSYAGSAPYTVVRSGERNRDRRRGGCQLGPAAMPGPVRAGLRENAPDGRPDVVRRLPELLAQSLIT